MGKSETRCDSEEQEKKSRRRKLNYNRGQSTNFDFISFTFYFFSGMIVCIHTFYFISVVHSSSHQFSFFSEKLYSISISINFPLENSSERSWNCSFISRSWALKCFFVHWCEKLEIHHIFVLRWKRTLWGCLETEIFRSIVKGVTSSRALRCLLLIKEVTSR